MSDYQAALKDYVEQAKAAGMSYDEVRQGLIGGGWDAAMVDQMLPEAFGAEGAPAPAAPPLMAPGITVEGAPPVMPVIAAGPPAMPPTAAAPPAMPPAAEQPAYAPPAYTPPGSMPPAQAPTAAAPPPFPAAPGAGYPMAPGWEADNNSGTGGPPPPEVEVMGWSWGGFGLNWIWGITNRVWISLLCFVPCVNLIVAIYLGIYGHKLAWQNRRFQSLHHFQETMKAWNLWGLIIFLVGLVGNVVSFIVQMGIQKGQH
jgi:hypothetical protein